MKLIHISFYILSYYNFDLNNLHMRVLRKQDFETQTFEVVASHPLTHIIFLNFLVSNINSLSPL